MNQNFKLYPFGFLFTRNRVNQVPKFYKYREILNTFHYYFDDTYGISLYEEDDSFILIHGHYQYVGENDYLISDLFLRNLLELYQTNYYNFLDTLDFIAGRYCVIIGDLNNIEVFQDATGARSVYYSLNSDCISSHANLIGGVTNAKKLNLNNNLIYPKISFDNSPYSNVKALLPNFKLVLFQRRTERFFPRKNNRYSNLSDNEKVDMIELLWKKQLMHYYNSNKRILVSITGGNDSRISLALAKKLKDSLEFFTYCKNPDYINTDVKREVVNEKDRIIVENILEDVSLNHKFIYYENEDLIISESAKSIMDKNSIGVHGRFLIGLYLNYFPEENNLHLRGTCLEIVQSVYLNSADFDNDANTVLERYLKTAEKYYHLLPEEAFKKIGLEGIEALGYDREHFNFHLLDLYYWEHRMGRWHPELLNETDIAFDTFLPFNLRSILEIGMSFSYEKRRSGFLFKELINKNFPILNFYGVNEIQNIYEQNKLYLNGLNKDQETDGNQEVLYFKKYYLHSSDDIKIRELKTTDNTIKIPHNYLYKNNYSQAQLTFSEEKGHVELTVLSQYHRSDALKYIKYQILVNNILILEEDISLWKFKNTINIFNLKKNDRISIRVLALRDLPKQSWEKASNLSIVHYQEHNHSHTFEERFVAECTSPYSNIKSGK